MKKVFVSLVTLSIMSLGIMNCARDVGTIDRTQPNKVKKSIFQDGDAWYYRQTVIDVPWSTGFTFTGYQDETYKIVWDIQENYLYAYRAHEYLDQGEEYATRPGTVYKGAPIAAYKISSHFDVIREYNAATGEQTNVISENTRDRPWYEREYMRVNWSDNKITDFTFFTGQISTTPIDYYVSEGDADEIDLPIITDGYIDIVSKIFAQPEAYTFETPFFTSGWYPYKNIPVCWFYGFSDRDCFGQALKIRASFLKVPTAAENDYEPRQYGDKDFQKFGYFRSERYSYDRRRGETDSARIYNVNRWNVWDKSHRDNDFCDEDGHCGDGSRCDFHYPSLDEDGNKLRNGTCTLPYAERPVRTIPWWVNQQFPEYLLDEAQNVIDVWNDVFKEMVANLQGVDVSTVPDVMVLCTSTVTGDRSADPSACVIYDDNAEDDEPGRWPQIGDLRYNHLYWVANPQESSPLGYGPSASDPTTGEIFSANAFYYGAAAETYAAYAQDVINLLTGDLAVEDLVDGQYIRDYIENVRRYGQNNPTSPLFQSKFSPAELQDALKTITPEQAYRIKERPKLLAARNEIKKKGDRIKASVDSGEAYYDYVSANLARLDDNPDSDAFMTGEFAQIHGPPGYDANYPPSPEEAEYLKPSLWAHPNFFEAQQNLTNELAKQNILMADFFDEAILYRALTWRTDLEARWINENSQAAWDALSQDEQDSVYQEMLYQALMEEIFLGAEIHEVGHTVGLRHNFAGSADALNFNDGYLVDSNHNGHIDGDDDWEPGYWEIRKDFTSSQIPTYQQILPEYWAKPLYGTMSPGYAGSTKIREKQFASIMDYGAKFNSDFEGVGKYDIAAINYAYGNLVQVFDFSQHNISGLTKRVPFGTLEKLVPGEYHYTAIPLILSQGFYYNEGSGTWTTPNVLHDDAWNLIRMRRWVDADTVPSKEEQANSTTFNADLVEVPFMFCSDDYHAGNDHCYRFDEGADSYERIRNTMQYYENYYFFNNFRRERALYGESYGPYIGRIEGRYFNYISSQFKHWVNDELILRNETTCPDVTRDGIVSEAHYLADLCGMPNYIGVMEAMNFWWRVLQVPNVGTYKLMLPDDDPDDEYFDKPVYEYVDPYDPMPSYDGRSFNLYGQPITLAGALDVELGDGKYQITGYDREDGYFFYNKPRYMGIWLDKYLALRALGDPFTKFIGVETNSDTRSFLINFNSIFSEEINNVLGSMLAENYEGYAPVLGELRSECRGIMGGGDAYSGIIYRQNQLWNGDPDPLLLNEITDGIQINPDDQYTVRLQTAFIGAAYFSYWTDDRDFSESMKVWMKGQADDIEIPAGTISYSDYMDCMNGGGDTALCDPPTYIEVPNPINGRTYAAQKRITYKVHYCITDPGDPDDPCDDEETLCTLENQPLSDEDRAAGNYAYVPDPDYFSIGYEMLKKIRDRFWEWSPDPIGAQVSTTALDGTSYMAIDGTTDYLFSDGVDGTADIRFYVNNTLIEVDVDNYMQSLTPAEQISPLTPAIIADIADLIDAEAGFDIAEPSVDGTMIILDTELSVGTGDAQEIRLLPCNAAEGMFAVINANLPSKVTGADKGWRYKKGIYITSIDWEFHVVDIMRSYLRSWEY